MKDKVIYWVGRFQFHEITPELLETYKNLLKQASLVNIVVCLSPLKNTKNNPFDFKTRKNVLRELLANTGNLGGQIYYLNDNKSDTEWSAQLDSLVYSSLMSSYGGSGDIKGHNIDDIIICGRQSTVGSYNGRFKFQAVNEDHIISYEKIVKQAIANPPATKDFRLGVLASLYERFTTAYTCVDIAIFNEDKTKILLGYKNSDKINDKIFYRFVGGFSDVKSKSFEEDARREVYEEVGIEITDIQYVASFIVDDLRYRNEEDKIKTILFSAKYMYGPVKPSDDLDGAKWFDVDKLKKEDIVTTHRPLFERLFNK